MPTFCCTCSCILAASARICGCCTDKLRRSLSVLAVQGWYGGAHLALPAAARAATSGGSGSATLCRQCCAGAAVPGPGDAPVLRVTFFVISRRSRWMPAGQRLWPSGWCLQASQDGVKNFGRRLPSIISGHQNAKLTLVAGGGEAGRPRRQRQHRLPGCPGAQSLRQSVSAGQWQVLAVCHRPDSVDEAQIRQQHLT